MKRLSLVPLAVLVAGLLLAVACAGETVVETVIVEKEVAVEKKVVETVVVEKIITGEKVVETVVVEKVIAGEKVVETVVVEKEVERVVVATAVPEVETFFGLPIPKTEAVTGAVPTPKSPAGTVVIRNPLELHLSGVPGTYDGQFLGASISLKFFTTDKGGNPVPQTAESWTIASDLSYIDIKIKEGIQWHDGYGEMTADDVVWNMNLGNPGVNPESVVDGSSQWTTFLGSNEAIKLDTYTTRFPVAQFNILWDALLFGQSGNGLGQMCKAAYEENGEDWALTHLVGNGPFRQVNFKRDDVLELERFDTNGLTVYPEVETLIYRAIPDDAVGEALLETGEVDIATRIPLRSYPKYTAMGFKVVGAGAGSFHSITFAGNYWESNKMVVDGTTISDGESLAPRHTYTHYIPHIGDPTRDTFGNPPDGFTSMTRAAQFRRALAMAFDRDLINEVLLAGAGWPNYVYGHDINNPNYQDKWFYEFDPVKAGQMLDEIGYTADASGKRGELPFFIRLGRGDEEIGTAVAGYWRELGIDVQEFRAQYQVFRPCLIARTCTSAWIHSAGVEGPQQPWDWPIFGSSHFSLGRPGYNVGFEDRFYGVKYIEMQNEPDRAKRIALRDEVAQYTWENAVSIGTVAVPNVALVNPKRVESWDMPLNLRESCCHHPELIKLAK